MQFVVIINNTELTVTVSSCFGGPDGKLTNLFRDNVTEFSCLKFAKRLPCMIEQINL